jgi:hypothetical protein
MDCREAVVWISQDLAAGLPEAQRRALSAHLEGCQACEAEREIQERIWAALGETEDEVRGEGGAEAASQVPAAFAAVAVPRLRQAVSAAATRRHARRRRQVHIAAWVTGSALALAAGWLIVARPGAHERAHGNDPSVAGIATQVPAAAEPPPPRASATPLPEPLAAFVADSLGSDGGRSQAISLVRAHYGEMQAEAPSELVEALIRTLRSDRNPGVRKKAAQALLGLQSTPEIRAAFVQVLRKDPNPAIRIIAVEALGRAARGFDPASIETLRERADDQDESRNLRARAARALQTLALF